MAAEGLTQLIGSGWRWLAVVGAAIVSASIAELLARKLISPRLAGAAAIVSGALVATIVGYLLFPPIMISSPDSTTFSVVGAVACAVYWVLLRLLLRGSTDARPTDHFRLGGALLLCGIVAGALTGLLSSSPFLGLLYCTPLGLLGGLLLGGPYFLVALLERRKEGRASTGTATEKVPARHSSDAKESPN